MRLKDGRLSVEAAHYYARIYGGARAGCLGELRRAGCSEEEAEDIFAATFERIMGKLDPAREGFREAQTVVLLKQACRQKLIDERRHRGVLRIVPLEDVGNRSDPTSEGPAETAENREAVAIAREAISSLSARDRSLFLQRHQLGLSPEEIMGRNPGLSRRTYRKIIQRANARALGAFEEIGSGARCAEMRREWLRRYVAEAASKEELRVVEAHLRRCRACGLEVARMHGHLHEVAAGLGVFLADGHGRGSLSDIPARLADALGSEGEALLGATRAARERLRELALRGATALPGSGGESTAGQLVGIVGTKTASVCAAGAIAAGCLAAGVVPGIGGLELAAPRHSHREVFDSASSVAPPIRSLASPAKRRAPEGAVVPGRQSVDSGSGRERGKGTRRGQAATRSLPEARTEYRTRPTISGQQTGAEFGGEATGTGVPLPELDALGGEGAPNQGEVSHSRSTGKSSSAGSKTAAEFGF